MASPIVRKAGLGDLSQILSFLRNHWNADHIFLKDRELLNWQHFNQESGDYNFILLEENGAVQGILGYIPSSHWAPAENNQATSLAIWKVLDSATVPGAGIRLLNELRRIEKPKRIIAIGVSQQAIKIYKRLGYRTGEMVHFALGPKFSACPQLHGSRTNDPLSFRGQRFDLLKASANPNLDALISGSDEKGWTYLERRFGQHPTYSYVGYFWQSEYLAVVTVHRVVRTTNLIVSRVVDVIGDFSALPSLALNLYALAVEEGWDYVDLVSSGLDRAEMLRKGYVLASKSVIIPHHFEPLEMRNVPLAFATKEAPSSSSPLFLADSDQDRPNLPKLVK